MNVVDLSAWLEYFADGPNAAFFAPAIEDVERLLVPSITILEVKKGRYLTHAQLKLALANKKLR